MFLFEKIFKFRACRLKKKAQHEANKVKLHGLDWEHKQLLHVVGTIRDTLNTAINEEQGEKTSYSVQLEDLIKENLSKYARATSYL